MQPSHPRSLSSLLVFTHEKHTFICTFSLHGDTFVATLVPNALMPSQNVLSISPPSRDYGTLPPQAPPCLRQSPT